MRTKGCPRQAGLALQPPPLPPLSSHAWQQLKVLGHAKALLPPEGCALEIQVSDQKRAQNSPWTAWQTSQTNEKIQGFVLHTTSTNPLAWLWCTPWKGLQCLGQARGQGPREGLPLKTVQKRSSKTFSQISASLEHRSRDPDLPHHPGERESTQRYLRGPAALVPPARDTSCALQIHLLHVREEQPASLRTPEQQLKHQHLREAPRQARRSLCREVTS